ncbi:MAG TPA: DUF1080 domain-containing protein [Gemmataceae bacterium]|nr:DUF1080 domain-containing protein [Gemmataceae bacterium]
MSMRLLWIIAVSIGAIAALMPAPAAEPQEDSSALQKDPTGWIDLLAGKDLNHWKRVPIPPGSPLKSKNPWSLDPNTHELVCDGADIHEMLLYEEPFDDGIFHVEWRFKKIEGRQGYNSGVYVRTADDGAIWHQAQVGNRNVGYLFGNTLVQGKPQRVKIDDKKPQRGKEAGEWNTYEVTCKGPHMTLWINGAVTATWDQCHVPKGHVGLEAEGWYIEFRNVNFKR